MKTENAYIIHPENAEQEEALKAFVDEHKIKYEIRKDLKSQDPDFGTKIQESRGKATEEKADLDDPPKQ
jgi:hypothetical protein